MERRCNFLDNFPGYNYNNGYGEYIVNKHGQRRPTDTRCLGSTLMKTMLKEVSEFCDPALKDNWSQKPHQQVNEVNGLVGRCCLLDSAIVYDQICYNPSCNKMCKLLNTCLKFLTGKINVQVLFLSCSCQRTILLTLTVTKRGISLHFQVSQSIYVRRHGKRDL